MGRLDDARCASVGAGDVRTRVEHAQQAYAKAVEGLVAALVGSALAEVADVLPGAAPLEVLGETNEDGLDILRIQRVRNAAGEVLYDIEAGHPDRSVEDGVDHVGAEYLDQLLEITCGDYFGEHVLGRAREV